MHIKTIIAFLTAAICLSSFSGCEKREPAGSTAQVELWMVSSDSVARLHWLGKKRLGIEGSAYYLMRIWELPETKRLESQTLDKLVTLPWRIWPTNAANAPVPFLRPLLSDVLEEECYFEIRQATNSRTEFVLAIRLPKNRAGVWETNLAVVAQSLTGVWPIKSQQSTNSWSLTRNGSPDLELARVGEWTILSSAATKGVFKTEIKDRIQHHPNPFSTSATNFWVETEFDLGALARISGASPSTGDLPRVFARVVGDGANAIVRGELTFPQPHQLDLDIWNFPTQLMHEPLTSFAAVRGVAKRLSATALWKALQPGAAPNQLYFWSLDGAAFNSYLAAPMSNATKTLSELTTALMVKGNSWLASNSIGNFQELTNSQGISWSGFPSASPFLTMARLDSGDFLYGGTLTDPGLGSSPPSQGMFQDVIRRTNLIAYQWEMSASRLQSWLYLSQSARSALRNPQLPLDSASLVWLSVLRPRLGTCAAVATLENPRKISFLRKSTVGLSALELHLLADWFESPQFPLGLQTLLTPSQKISIKSEGSQQPKSQ